jgi:hypothetical protein
MDNLKVALHYSMYKLRVLTSMEVREGNVVSSLLVTIITTKLSQSTIVSVVTRNASLFAPITIFVEEETNVGKDLDIVEDSDRAIQGIATMHSIREGDKEHLFSKVLPNLALTDPNMINLLGRKKYVDLISTTPIGWVLGVSFNVYPS